MARKAKPAAPKPTPTFRSGGRSSRTAIINGYRSGLEDVVARDLTQRGVSFRYEEERILYRVPEKQCRYTPDFVLANGVIVETKGRFLTADRQKHILIKSQHPELDIRFVFSNSRSRISKTSRTTYADWCLKNGFTFADKAVPEEWIT